MKHATKNRQQGFVSDHMGLSAIILISFMIGVVALFQYTGYPYPKYPYYVKASPMQELHLVKEAKTMTRLTSKPLPRRILATLDAIKNGRPVSRVTVLGLSKKIEEQVARAKVEKLLTTTSRFTVIGDRKR